MMSSPRDPPASKRPAFGSRTKSGSSEPKEQRLFMLEFFVHSISGDRLAKLNQMFFVPTSVCFRFLTFDDDSIEVTPVDPMFEPQAGVADDVEYFYAGRSVVFAIAEDALVKGSSEFSVALIVQKKMPEKIKPDVLVGVSFVDLSKPFAELKTALQRSFEDTLPEPQSCEAEYPLLFNEEHVGDIFLYTRLSAFGQTIVTEFDAPPEKMSSSTSPAFVFKSEELEESKSLAYKCRVIDSASLDICEGESNREIPSCPVCAPPRYPCLPCGLTYGAVARPTTPALNERQSSTKKAILSAGCGPIQSSRGSQQPCGKAVVLKVSGLLDAGDAGKKQPTVTVLPESEATGPNSPPDPEHDIFILRIGKKGLVAAGEKSDLQLEMRTPKGPERRPPIRYETREAQTEIAKEGKKGKGKGKGKKGNKGKK